MKIVKTQVIEFTSSEVRDVLLQHVYDKLQLGSAEFKEMGGLEIETPITLLYQSESSE